MSGDATSSDGATGAFAMPDPDVCTGVVELVTEYLDGALHPELRARFEAHVGTCEGCEVYVAQMLATIRATGGLDPERVPPAMLERLVAVYRAVREV
jgi:anti-sigma factor RsiW